MLCLLNVTFRSMSACGGLTLPGCQVPTKAALSLRHLNWKGERKYNERLMGRDKERERSFTNYCHEQNRLDLGNQFNLLPIKSEQDDEK